MPNFIQQASHGLDTKHAVKRRAASIIDAVAFYYLAKNNKIWPNWPTVIDEFTTEERQAERPLFLLNKVFMRLQLEVAESVAKSDEQTKKKKNLLERLHKLNYYWRIIEDFITHAAADTKVDTYNQALYNLVNILLSKKFIPSREILQLVERDKIYFLGRQPQTSRFQYDDIYYISQQIPVTITDDSHLRTAKERYGKILQGVDTQTQTAILSRSIPASMKGDNPLANLAINTFAKQAADGKPDDNPVQFITHASYPAHDIKNKEKRAEITKQHLKQVFAIAAQQHIDKMNDFNIAEYSADKAFEFNHAIFSLLSPHGGSPIAFLIRLLDKSDKQTQQIKETQQALQALLKEPFAIKVYAKNENGLVEQRELYINPNCLFFTEGVNQLRFFSGSLADKINAGSLKLLEQQLFDYMHQVVSAYKANDEKYKKARANYFSAVGICHQINKNKGLAELPNFVPVAFKDVLFLYNQVVWLYHNRDFSADLNYEFSVKCLLLCQQLGYSTDQSCKGGKDRAQQLAERAIAHTLYCNEKGHYNDCQNQTQRSEFKQIHKIVHQQSVQRANPDANMPGTQTLLRVNNNKIIKAAAFLHLLITAQFSKLKIFFTSNQTNDGVDHLAEPELSFQLAKLDKAPYQRYTWKDCYKFDYWAHKLRSSFSRSPGDLLKAASEESQVTYKHWFAIQLDINNTRDKLMAALLKISMPSYANAGCKVCIDCKLFQELKELQLVKSIDSKRMAFNYDKTVSDEKFLGFIEVAKQSQTLLKLVTNVTNNTVMPQVDNLATSMKSPQESYADSSSTGCGSIEEVPSLSVI